MRSKNVFKAAALIIGAMLIGAFAFVTANEVSTDDWLSNLPLLPKC